MERLTAKKKLAVVRLYFSGLSYDEIAARSRVSKGTVANVVAELRAGVIPEAADVGEHIELLRELSLDLKQSKLSPGQCAVGLILLTRISECGLDPADIDRWPVILKVVRNEDDAKEFVRLIYSIQEVQQRSGLSIEALDNKFHELEKKAGDLGPMSDKLKDCKKQLTELIRQRDELANSVAILEQKNELLTPQVKELERREQNLSRQIADMEPKVQKAETTLSTLKSELQKLKDIGLSFSELAEFHEKLQVIAQRHVIEPSDLRSRLLHELESLDKGLALETLIQGRQQEMDKMEQAIAKGKKEVETTRTVVDSLKQEKTNLAERKTDLREKVSREIAKIIPIATGTVKQLVQELQHGCNEALGEVRLLRDEAIEVGKEVGQYQAILQVNQWLNELLALVRGEENVEAQRVRVISLAVVRGIAGWLKQHNTNSITIASLSLATDKLIRDLEQWQT